MDQANTRDTNAVNSSAAHLRVVTPLWRNMSFMLMWTSVAASGFGDRLIQLAAWSLLGVQLAETNAASVQAGVSFFFFLPYVLLGPPAGWLADTLPRKWIMLFCDEARAGVLLLAFLLVPAGMAGASGASGVSGVISGDHHWKVFAIISGVGVLAALFSPAKAATIPQIVPMRQLQQANAIVLGIAVIASLIGFQVGGKLIEGSIRSGLIVGVLTYAVSGLFFAFMKPREHVYSRESNRPGQVERLFEAVRYIAKHRAIGQLIGLSVLFWGAATVLMAAIASLCKTRYGIDSGQVISHTSTMMAVLGGGMLLSSLWVVWINTRRESSWFVMGTLSLAGVCMLGMAINRSFGVGLVLSFGTGFFGNAAMICVATLTQSLSPDYIRGRVFGVRDLLNTSSAVLVNLVIWRLPDADRFMIPTLGVVATGLAIVAGIGLWVQITSGPLTMRRGNFFWRLTRAFILVWHRLEWVGRNNIPHHGRIIIASNHTAGIDPLIIQAAIPRLIKWVMLRDYRYRLFDPLWRVNDPITVDGEGSQLTELRQMLHALKNDTLLGIFPEGSAQRGDRVLKPFQPGVGLLAKRGKAKIVPVWIDGTPQAKRLLWHFLRPSRSVVIFGKAYTPDTSMSNDEITEDLRERMLTLSRRSEG